MSGLFGSTTIKGNRITDFAQTTATVGVVIPFGWGTFPCDGNVIWAPLPPKEHRKVQSQGKGGVKQETYTYTLSYAIAFCKGPINGFLWIKRNGKVVYSTDPNAPIEDLEYAAKWAEKVAFFYGTRTQLPDSTIESYEGSGQVSAFRGLVYIVVEDDNVTEGGGAVPTYEACCIKNAEVYLTTPLYVLEAIEELGVSGATGAAALDVGMIELEAQDEAFSVSADIVSGDLYATLESAEAPDESFEVSADIVSGLLDVVLLDADAPPESLEVNADLVSGTLDAILVVNDAPPESLEVSANIVGGSLT